MEKIAVTKYNRKSGVELLRLFCMFGIIICHAFSSGEELTGINKYLCIFFNSSFNAGYGVVCFMLITGYYGIKLTLDRFNKIYSTIYVCSITAIILMLAFDKPSLLDILTRLIPVSSRVMWYASCYIYLMLLSPFLNKLVASMSQKTYSILLAVLIAIFYIAPTFLYFDIMMDKGKGLVHMITAYLIGRYLKLYPVKIKKNVLWSCLILLIAFCFAGNVLATIVARDISWPFSRDCTIVTLLVSVCALLIAVDCDFVSKPINVFASKVFYMYLLGQIPVLVARFICLSNYIDSMVYVPMILAVSALSMLISFVIAVILQYPVKLFGKALEFIEKTGIKIYKKHSPKILDLTKDKLKIFIQS